MSSSSLTTDPDGRQDSAPVVAVIGLGAMGLPMATRLIGTYHVSGYDPIDDNIARFTSVGGRGVASPAEAAMDAQVILIAVRTLSQLEDVLFGENGVCETLVQGSTIIVTSTVGVPGIRRVGEELVAHGMLLVDAPVSGGPSRAGQGELLVLVGASGKALEASRPVLTKLAASIIIVGPNIGDGQAMKTVNQLLCGVHIAAAAEALALAKGLGLDLTMAFEALGAGAASSFMLNNRGSRIIEALDRGIPEVLSRVDIFVKDMAIVIDAGRLAGLALPVSSATEQLFRLGESAGLGASDDSTITTIL